MQQAIRELPNAVDWNRPLSLHTNVQPPAQFNFASDDADQFKQHSQSYYIGVERRLMERMAREGFIPKIRRLPPVSMTRQAAERCYLKHHRKEPGVTYEVRGIEVVRGHRKTHSLYAACSHLPAQTLCNPEPISV